jgi:hypothetical protein
LDSRRLCGKDESKDSNGGIDGLCDGGLGQLVIGRGTGKVILHRIVLETFAYRLLDLDIRESRTWLVG